jgi:hypothetical protein
MPHYADGTEAKIGDVVKGKGYNTKHEIIGKVVTTAQPYLPSMRRPSTGFAEEDEEDDD